MFLRPPSDRPSLVARGACRDTPGDRREVASSAVSFTVPIVGTTSMPTVMRHGRPSCVPSCGRPPTVVLVVPCFDADLWLNDIVSEIVAWLERTSTLESKASLLFVHSGSNRISKPARDIDRWIHAVAYSATSRAQPGRVRIMQIKKELSRAEALRQGLVEASEWPQHFGGRPDLIGWWSLDMASAPLDGIDTLVAALSPNAHMAFGRGRPLLGGAFTLLVSLLLGLPLGLEATSGAALFRAGPELEGAVRTRFYHERLALFQLVWRYQWLLRTGRATAAPQPLACVFDVVIESWVDARHLDRAPRRWSRAPSSAECVGLLHCLLYLRLLFWVQWGAGDERAARRAIELAAKLMLGLLAVCGPMLALWAYGTAMVALLAPPAPPSPAPLATRGEWWKWWGLRSRRT